MSAGQSDSLEERAAALKGWAVSRIRLCRAQETKFGAAWLREKHQHGPPQALVEAWTERRALEAVLRMLARRGDP